MIPWEGSKLSPEGSRLLSEGSKPPPEGSNLSPDFFVDFDKQDEFRRIRWVQQSLYCAGIVVFLTSIPNDYFLWPEGLVSSTKRL